MLSKDRIIAESTDLFVRYGVKSVRMDDIASRLGVSKRTIYELFGDRESLIRTCVEYFYNRQERRYEARMASARNVIEEFMLLLEDWENSVTVNMNFMSDLERFYPEIYRRISSERHRQGAEPTEAETSAGRCRRSFLSRYQRRVLRCDPDRIRFDDLHFALDLSLGRDLDVRGVPLYYDVLF